MQGERSADTQRPRFPQDLAFKSACTLERYRVLLCIGVMIFICKLHVSACVCVIKARQQRLKKRHRSKGSV